MFKHRKQLLTGAATQPLYTRRVLSVIVSTSTSAEQRFVCMVVEKVIDPIQQIVPLKIG